MLVAAIPCLLLSVVAFCGSGYSSNFVSVARSAAEQSFLPSTKKFAVYLMPFSHLDEVGHSLGHVVSFLEHALHLHIISREEAVCHCSFFSCLGPILFRQGFSCANDNLHRRRDDSNILRRKFCRCFCFCSWKSRSLSWAICFLRTAFVFFTCSFIPPPPFLHPRQLSFRQFQDLFLFPC